MKTQFVNTLKPAESYTHTHTGNLLLSQIFQNLIFSTVSILLSINVYADTTDIAANAATSNCTNTITGTYSGTTNFEAKWTPKNIELNWYNGDTKITPSNNAANNCTYDSALTIPSNPPSKTGYVFAGWKVKVAPFDLSTLNTSIKSTSFEYKAISAGISSSYNLDTPQTSSGANAAGLNNGEWMANFSHGTIYGRAYCSSRSERVNDAEEEPYWPSGRSSVWRATNAEVMVGRGATCWCQATSYVPQGGTRKGVSTANWISLDILLVGDGCDNFSTYEEQYECTIWDCENLCAYRCANETKYSSSGDYPNTYLPALYGITQ